MESTRIVRWARRGAIALAVVLLGGFVGGSLYFTEVLERDLLTPRPLETSFDIEVAALGGGRILLTRTALTEQEGVWGVVGANGAYGQAAEIVELGDETVERTFRTLQGRFEPGDRAAFDQYAFVGDPSTALGIDFEEIRLPGELGVNAAWFVPGVRQTWVVFVHGKGLDERKQSLRILPTLVEAGFPVLVITYRNDDGAAPSESGLYAWGRDEWRDVEVAATYAVNRGGTEIVLIGYSMGAEIVSMFLHDSDMAGMVRGVVFDSPVLDLEGVVDNDARERGIPGILTASAKVIARLRFDLQWPELDQVARAAEFDVPILLLHGTEDDTVPIAGSDAFAAGADQDLVRYERFDGAGHVTVWNVGPERYEGLVSRFLDRVSSPGQPQE
ncbi:MAG TPA: alpha/beta fold hydrolase [Acidimicrobiia bacterium]